MCYYELLFVELISCGIPGLSGFWPTIRLYCLSAVKMCLLIVSLELLGKCGCHYFHSCILNRCGKLECHMLYSQNEIWYFSILNVWFSDILYGLLTHWPLGDLDKILKIQFSNLFLLIGIYGSFHDIALRWMSQDLTDGESAMVQVMAWCCQATSHYLNQCWPRYMLPYAVTRPQCVNVTCYIFKTGFDAKYKCVIRILNVWFIDMVYSLFKTKTNINQVVPGKNC